MQARAAARASSIGRYGQRNAGSLASWYVARQSLAGYVSATGDADARFFQV